MRSGISRRHLPLGLLAGMRPLRAASSRVRHPPPGPGIDPKNWYPLLLLDEALRTAGASPQLEATPENKVQSRWAKDLAEGADSIDVAWFMTDPQREAQLLPVRIPIFRGLFGWRLLLVPAKHVAEWSEVVDLATLRRKTFLQGHDWPDTQILRSNGLRVFTATQASNLVEMLRLGRADAYPRAVPEALAEQAALAPELVIEPRLVLHYPAAMYFFVNRRRPELAVLLQAGLERMVERGSLQALFDRHHGADFRQARVRERRVIELSNPLLGPQTPLNRDRLWVRP